MKYKQLRPTGIVIHCSASPPHVAAGVKEITQWHRKRGFSTIGYHYVVRRDGSIEKGRQDNEQGAHVHGHNHYTLGVCMEGGVDKAMKPENNFTMPQWGALAMLVATLLLDNTDLEFVVGHRDMPGVNKACPSFNAMEWAESHSLIINLLERNQQEKDHEEVQD